MAIYVLGFLIVQVVLILVIYVIFLIARYEDSVVTNGDAYGFMIGESKREVYRNAYGKISSLNSGHTKLFIREEVDIDAASKYALKPQANFMVETSLNVAGFESFSKKNKWKIYFNASYYNFIEFEFRDDKLTRIYRHRKDFELP